MQMAGEVEVSELCVPQTRFPVGVNSPSDSPDSDSRITCSSCSHSLAPDMTSDMRITRTLLLSSSLLVFLVNERQEQQMDGLRDVLLLFARSLRVFFLFFESLLEPLFFPPPLRPLLLLPL